MSTTLTRLTRPPAPSAAVPPPRGRGDQTRPRVVIFDAHEPTRQVLTDLFTDYHVDVVGLDGDPTVALADLHPSLGLAIIDQIHQATRPGLPVIIHTVRLGTESDSYVLRRGGFALLLKGLTPIGELLGTIQAAHGYTLASLRPDPRSMPGPVRATRSPGRAGQPPTPAPPSLPFLEG